ncbi:hypothetical protein [Enterococcus devriesei]|uniref:hypothetical protein n=1 Tax=Enterococcus devriesei TaxID=319970 RepID=UPI0036D35677
MNLQHIYDGRIEEGVQMIRKRKIAKYYMKEQGFTKREAYETAEKTQPEFEAGRAVYLALFNEAKPTFADRTGREKALRVYQVFSFIALLCYVVWLFNNGYLSHARVTDNFLLIALAINLALISYWNEKTTEKIHDRKTKALFKNDPEAIKKLAQVEEIKRTIFRAEHRGISLVEERKKAEGDETSEINKIITLDKIKHFKNKIKK